MAEVRQIKEKKSKLIILRRQRVPELLEHGDVDTEKVTIIKKKRNKKHRITNSSLSYSSFSLGILYQGMSLRSDKSKHL